MTCKVIDPMTGICDSDGGQTVREFECEQIVTLKGWALLTAASLIARAKESRQKKPELLEIRPDEATA